MRRTGGRISILEKDKPTITTSLLLFLEVQPCRQYPCATQGKGYLTFQSKRTPKANIGTVEKVSKGKYRLLIDGNGQEIIVGYKE